MTNNKRSHISRLVAIISFLLGSAIFASYYFTGASTLITLGFFFILVAGFINLINLILVGTQILKAKQERRHLFITCFFILINIPIVLLYCWAILSLMNYMRITFINETSSVLTNIKITGCDEMYIESLKPNEKKIVWVGISGDCSVMIDFIKDGKREKENVVGYTTNGAGDKITYKIGADNIAARK